MGLRDAHLFRGAPRASPEGRLQADPKAAGVAPPDRDAASLAPSLVCESRGDTEPLPHHSKNHSHYIDRRTHFSGLFR